MASEEERERNDQDAFDADPYRTLFMRSADAILIIEGDRFVDCNDATARMLGYERREDLLRTHPSELSPPTQPDGQDSFEKANEMIEIAFERGSHRFEWDHKRANGEVFPVEVLLTAVPQNGRRILHVVWRDVTERKQLEEQLRHAQKMEAVGKLAGGIAHDFNNLLMAILGNCDLMDLHLGEQSSVLPYVGQIRKAGLRAADLTRQLLAFSRKQVIRTQVLDLNAAVKETEMLLHRLIGEDVQLRSELAEEPVRVRADRGQLEQVIVNLVTNARDAMPHGGQVQIETRLVEFADDTIGLQEGLRAGRYAMLAVTDTGMGMDDAVVRRVFDPFFTTKPVGQGTGLGLSTVYGIVKQSGGEISIYSVPGRGTAVKVYLPVTRDALDSSSALAPDPPVQGGVETVLVAEDEAMVSTVIAGVLRGAGYTVHAVEDGQKAYEAFMEAPGKVDLLLTDVIMPKMNGPELVAKLATAGHRPKVLYASGYTANALGESKVLRDSIEIIEKPFSSRVLLRKVRAVLDKK